MTTKIAAKINQPKPTERPYSWAAAFWIVKEGLTLLVEGNSVGNIEATVVAKLPKINSDENKKPVPSFLNVLIQNCPSNPTAPSKANNDFEDWSKKCALHNAKHRLIG